MDEPREYPVPVASDEEVAAFISRYGTPYDPETDDYHREPFVADIREGKNDPIYNAHSYHTKVPPRAIIPYILHYTEPGDIILDPFCGSGMTGVAALMCENPPEDVLQTVPGAEKGARRAILNDLSPAACHIAYNYCTPVDVEALKAEFERIKAAVKEEFDWLYGTEHYEPAVGLYEPTKPEVACHLKNPPLDAPQNGLISVVDREWELIDRSEVERRMGPEALARQPIPEGVEQFICIPATIQYTVWSDVYKCQGMVGAEEQTDRVNKRTNLGITKKVRRPRGCGGEIVLWNAALDPETGKVKDTFACPHCGQAWRKLQLGRVGEVAVRTVYGVRLAPNSRRSARPVRFQRHLTQGEFDRLNEIADRGIPYWHPADAIDMGREMLQHGLQKRGKMGVSDFFFKRQTWALSRLWHEFGKCERQIANALQFLFTSIHQRFSKRTKWHPSRFGQCSMPNNLYIPSLMVENNVLDLCVNKFGDILAVPCLLSPRPGSVTVRTGCATDLECISDSTVDYVFTDPPFGQNIYYADCSILWEAWLQNYTDEAKEIVVNERRDNGAFKTLNDYRNLMSRVFSHMWRILKPGRWATVEFNNSDGRVFEAIKQVARDSGFIIENMVFLDKVQKTFKQIRGDKGEEDVVGHDVIFNLRKPASAGVSRPSDKKGGSDRDASKLEDLVAETVRHHLCTLPRSIEKDPNTYTNEHRTTPFLNTMLMNALIPRSGVDVSRLNLPFIDRVCSRYFRRVDGRWYLRDEAVGDDRPNGNKGRLFQIPDDNVTVEDEKSAIAWLRQTLATTPMRIGELRPHWMKATVKLTGELSTQFERFLRENFWLDRSTRRWRIPTADELAELNDHERQRACHDAERFLEGKLSPHPTDAEILGWIEKLYSAAGRLEEEALGLVEPGEEPTLPADLVAYYRMMPRLLQSVLKENVDASAYTRASRQCRTAARKIQEHDDRKEAEAQSRSGPRQGKLFD